MCRDAIVAEEGEKYNARPENQPFSVISRTWSAEEVNHGTPGPRQDCPPQDLISQTLEHKRDRRYASDPTHNVVSLARNPAADSWALLIGAHDHEP